MKLTSLLEFDKKVTLALQQALLDHEDVEDVELIRTDPPDGITFKVTLADSDVKWFVDYWDMLDGGPEIICTVARWGQERDGKGRQVRVPSDPAGAAAQTVTAIYGVFP